MNYAIFSCYVDFPMGSSFPTYCPEYGNKLTKEKAEQIVLSLNDKESLKRKKSNIYNKCGIILFIMT